MVDAPVHKIQSSSCTIFAFTDVEVDRAQPDRTASHGRKPRPASISGSALSAIRATLK